MALVTICDVKSTTCYCAIMNVTKLSNRVPFNLSFCCNRVAKKNGLFFFHCDQNLRVLNFSTSFSSSPSNSLTMTVSQS